MFLNVFSIPVSIAGIVASIIALKKAIKAGKVRSTDTLALVALIFSIIGIVVASCFTLLWLVCIVIMLIYWGFVITYILAALAMIGIAI